MEDLEISLKPGLVIGKNYRINRIIGVGGMSAVYEAYDCQNKKLVAIKCLDPALTYDDENKARFQREAMAASRVGHPNICKVLSSGMTQQGLYFIVMELLVGITLLDVFHSEGPLPHKRAVSIICGILSALNATHREGIIHRDLKPENIFLHKDKLSQKERVKLLDFGVSRFLDDSLSKRLTKTGKILGTPLYVSPEQALSSHDIDHRSDLWGVGVLLYEAVTGCSPFNSKNTAQMLMKIIRNEATPPSYHIPTLSARLEYIILKSLRKNPDLRYQDAASFATDLICTLEEGIY